MLLLSNTSKRSLIKIGKKNDVATRNIIGEIVKTREETMAISEKIKEGKDQFVVFNYVMGLKPRREPLP